MKILFIVWFLIHFPCNAIPIHIHLFLKGNYVSYAMELYVWLSSWIDVIWVLQLICCTWQHIEGNPCHDSMTFFGWYIVWCSFDVVIWGFPCQSINAATNQSKSRNFKLQILLSKNVNKWSPKIKFILYHSNGN